MQAENNKKTVVVFCPSKGRQCGIARYSQYVCDSLLKEGFHAVVVSSVEEAWEARNTFYTTLIIQHEYGIYCNNNSNFRSPSVSELIRLDEKLRTECVNYQSCLIMHTFHPSDHVAAITNMEILSSGIKVFHLNSLGSSLFNLGYLEHGVPMLAENSKHGVSQQKKIRIDSFTIATFGLLSPNKRINALIDVAAECGARVLANFATRDQVAAQQLCEYAVQLGVDLSLSTDFLDEQQLVEFLSKADVCLSLQDDIPHYATSGSARLMLNAGKPLVTSLATQFADLSNASAQATEEQIPALLSALRDDQDFYSHMTSMAEIFRRSNAIDTIYKKLLVDIQVDANQEEFQKYWFKTGKDFWSPSTALYSCDEIPMMFANKQQGSVDGTDEILRDAGCRLSSHPGVVTRMDGDIMPYFHSNADPSLGSFARYFAPYSQIRSAIEAIGSALDSQASNELPHLSDIDSKNIKYIVKGVKVLEPEDKLSLLDQILSPSIDSDVSLLELHRFNLGLAGKLIQNRPQNASIESSVISSLTVEPGMVNHFLRLLLPSYQESIEKYLATHSIPSVKSVRRIKWVTGLLAALMKCTIQEDGSIARGSNDSSFVNRYIFFVEEFLWMDSASFSKYVQLAFSKLPLRSKRTSSVLERLASSGNSLDVRVQIICEHLKYAYWERGIPLVLLSYKCRFDHLASRYNKQLPHLRLLTDSEPFLAFSGFEPESSDFLVSTDRTNQEALPLYMSAINLNEASDESRSHFLSSIKSALEWLPLCESSGSLYMLAPFSSSH